ncbi:macrophage mannose receptor 1-like isoform X1, partial [Leptotrombidium deliense]
MNASLITIRSAEENEFIRQTFTRLTLWLGARRVSGTRQWKWIDGSDVIYTNWNPGEPNNDDTEECIQYYNNGPHAGFWNDYPCTPRRESAICEITLSDKEETKDEYSCEEGWTQFEQICYLWNTTEVSQKDNDAYCTFLNSKMVSIHSQSQLSFLNSKLSNLRFWTAGIRDKNDRNKFTWSDGTTWDFVNWAVNEPTRFSIEKCVVVSAGRYFTENCNNQHIQICQKNVTSKTSQSNAINQTYIFHQLLEMKYEILDLMTKLPESEALQNARAEHSDSHVYVFAIFFLVIFGVIAYLGATFYKNNGVRFGNTLLYTK